MTMTSRTPRRFGRTLGRAPARAALVGAIAALLATGLAATPAHADPTLVITTPNLLLDQGSGATIAVSASTPQVWYSVADDQGNGAAAGVTTTGTIDLSSLGPGYYRLSAQAIEGSTTVTRSTSFGIVTPLPDGVVSASSPFGAATHFAQRQSTDLLPIARQAGISHIRDELYWEDVEKSPGQYTWPDYDGYITRASSLGIDTLLVADYGNPLYDGGAIPTSSAGLAAYANYADAVVGHYNMSSVEVWNEFNGGQFGYDPCGYTADCYLPLVKAVHDKVTADHPQVTVVGPADVGVDSPRATDLIRNGGINDIGAYSIHPYQYPGGPEWLGGPGDTLNGLRAILDNAGASRPIWLSEMGWPTGTGDNSTPESAQAADLVRLYAVALANGATRIYWYDFLNDGSDPSDIYQNFGMVRQPDPANGVDGYAPKPVLVAQAVAARQLAGKQYTGQDTLSGGAWSTRYGDGANATRIVWTSDGDGRVATVSASGPVTVTSQYGAARTLTPNVNGTVTLPIGTEPVYLSGPVTGVTGGASTGRITGYGGLCVDVRGGLTANGTPVQNYECNDTAAQAWTVAPDHTLRAFGKCLALDGGGTANATPTVLADCDGSGGQVWQPRNDGSLYNPQSDKCLDDPESSTTSGTQLQIWDCYPNPNQMWTLP